MIKIKYILPSSIATVLNSSQLQLGLIVTAKTKILLNVNVQRKETVIHPRCLAFVIVMHSLQLTFG